MGTNPLPVVLIISAKSCPGGSVTFCPSISLTKAPAECQMVSFYQQVLNNRKS